MAKPRPASGRQQLVDLVDDGATVIPDKADLQRSREILDELYRRAGEFHRPEVEREYIRRLLRRF